MWSENQQPTAKYNNGGSGTALAPTVASMPLDELSKQLESASIRISGAVDRTRTIADALFGSEPEPKQAGGATIPPSGKVGGLNHQAASIHFWLGELERQVSRLNPLA